MILQKYLRIVSIVLLLIAALVTVLFFVVNFPIVGPDSYFHLANLDQYIALHAEGITLPHWMPNDFRGFGSSSLYFYPPLVYVIGSVIHIFGGTVERDLNMLMFASTCLSFLTCRHYLSILGVPRKQLWSASLIYAIGPYPFFDAIIRSAIPEYLALAWVPLIFAGLELSLRSEKIWSIEGLKALIVSCVACTLLVLTNMAIVFVLIISLPIMILATIDYRKSLRILPFAIGAVLALLCTAFYTLPVIHFKNAAQLGQLVLVKGGAPFTQTPFGQLLNFHEAMRTLGHPAELITIILIPITLILSISWFRSATANKNNRQIINHGMSLGWALILFLILIVHVPFIAGPVAKVFPILGLVQFAFRFFILLNLSIAVWIGCSYFPKIASYSLLYRCLSSLIVLAMAGIAITHVPYNSRYAIEQRIGWTVPEYASSEASHDPNAVIQFVNSHQNDPEISPQTAYREGDTVKLLNRYGNRSEFHAILKETEQVRFHRFYWPQWELTYGVSQSKIPLSADSNGVLIATLPPGEYDLALQIVKSSSELLGGKFSIIGCIVLLTLLTVSFSCKTPAIMPQQPGRTNADEDSRSSEP